MTGSFPYNEGFYDGWSEGRENLAASIVEFVYYMAEYHTELEPFVSDLLHNIEEELGRPYEGGEDGENNV